MKAAADYHNQQLLIKYGIIPFANLILELRFKERQAVLLNRKLIARRHFRAMAEAVRLIRAKAEKEEMFKCHTADRFRRCQLLRLTIRALREHLVHSQQTQQAKLTMCQIRVRLRFLYYTAFVRWAQALPALRAERKQL